MALSHCLSHCLLSHCLSQAFFFKFLPVVTACFICFLLIMWTKQKSLPLSVCDEFTLCLSLCHNILISHFSSPSHRFFFNSFYLRTLIRCHQIFSRDTKQLLIWSKTLAWAYYRNLANYFNVSHCTFYIRLLLHQSLSFSWNWNTALIFLQLLAFKVYKILMFNQSLY